jgi:hypothetical protein
MLLALALIFIGTCWVAKGIYYDGSRLIGGWGEDFNIGGVILDKFPKLEWVIGF